MTNTQTHRLWVAHGPAGAVGTIQQDGDVYVVRMLGRDEPAGSYPEHGGREERAVLPAQAGLCLARVPGALTSAHSAPPPPAASAFAA